MSNRAFVIGVGMTKFAKPGTKEGDYPEWGREAGERALQDAGISYEQVEQAFAGYCYGDSTCGQRALYGLGLTGVPVVNVNNNCSTGSTALYLARQAVRGGLADCALAVGFEKMERGSLSARYTDRTNPMDRHMQALLALRPWEEAPPAPQMFGAAGREHMERYGSRPEHYAWIGWKNHHHSVNNPYAQFQTDYTLEQIVQAPEIYAPLTRLQCSPTSDGSAAAVLASERFVERHGLWDRAIELAGQSMCTDLASTFDSDSSIRVVGYDMSRTAAERAYAEAGVACGRRRRMRAPRLLQRQRADQLRGPRVRGRGRGTPAGRGRSDHLRRRGAPRQPLGRADLQGPPARRHGSGPVRGADLAAARHGRGASGSGRGGRPAAQHRTGRRRRRRRVPPAPLSAAPAL